jgi:hypothetical protein
LSAAAAVMAVVWLIGNALASPQARPPAAKKTSDTVFKNIQVMKDVPVDDFMGTMGVMCAALGFDCSDCHEGAGTEKVNWAADTPKKVRARGMVRMMTAINRDNFAGLVVGVVRLQPKEPRGPQARATPLLVAARGLRDSRPCGTGRGDLLSCTKG